MATTKKTIVAPADKAEAPKKITKKVTAPKAESVDKVVVKKEVAPKAAKAPAAPKAAKETTPKATKKTPVAKTASQDTLHTVEFIKFSPESKVVEIAGSFNNWKPAKMKKDKEGNWKLKLDLAAGQHQYKYVFEGASWEHDPSVDSIPDGQGGWNNLKTL